MERNERMESNVARALFLTRMTVQLCLTCTSHRERERERERESERETEYVDVRERKRGRRRLHRLDCIASK